MKKTSLFVVLLMLGTSLFAQEEKTDEGDRKHTSELQSPQ